MKPADKAVAQSRKRDRLAGAKGPGPRTQAEYRFPDFMCVGVQKSGTTWLDANLRDHPQLWLPPIKELQYFSELYAAGAWRWAAQARESRGRKLLARYIQQTPKSEWDYRLIAVLADIASGWVSDGWYGRVFSLASAEAICGEISPDYAQMPEEGIRHILRLAPEVKIIMSLRDPIERSWSHLRMLARKQKAEGAPNLESMAQHPDILRRANYPAMIANWTACVPSDRFQVIFMDDIASEPDRVLEQVCGFLGVEYRESYFGDAASPVHVGEAQEMPPPVAAILKERLRPVYDGIARLYPERAAAWMARHFG